MFNSVTLNCFLYVTGLSGRYKFRSKNASERGRTPNEQSPETHSATGSPRDESPQNDEVFAAFTSEEKHIENNSNSNERTLKANANSDETIIANDYRKSKSDTHIRRSKSALNSRACTPGPVGEIQHAEVQVIPAIELAEVAKTLDSKISGHLHVPKPKEKSPSPLRQNQQEVEEPSFANTLDDIATMGTNEVADIDPYMDERPLSALPVNVDDIQNFIPTVNYIQPISQIEEAKESAVVSQHEDCVKEKASSISVKVETSESKEPIADQSTPAKSKMTIAVNDKSYESVEQPIEEMAEELVTEPIEANEQHADVVEIEPACYPTQEIPNVAYSSADLNEEVNTENIEGKHVTYETNFESISNRGSLEDINIRPSSSFASSTGMASANLERQFTPLSFSSSDAAFYSPADSPDESLSEKLKDRPNGSQTQVKNWAVLMILYSLITLKCPMIATLMLNAQNQKLSGAES